MKFLEYSLYFTMFTAFFPTPGYLYVQGIISIIQFIAIMYLVAKKEISLKDILNKYSVFLMALLLFSGVSILWVKDVSSWLVYSVVLFAGTINSLILWLTIARKNIVNNLIKVFLLAILLHNIVGWFEVITGIYPFAFSIENLAYNQLLRRPITFFKNVNDFATYLLFALIFLISYEPIKSTFSKIPFTLKQTLKWLLTLSTFGLIIMVGSRGILLISILSTILLAILKIDNSLFRKRIVLIGIGSFVLALIALVVIVGLIDIEALDPGDSARVYLTLNGLEYLKDTVFVGVGPGNVSHYLESYRYFPVGHLRTIHNWWVEFLVMYGLVFFVIYISMYIQNILKSFQKFRASNNFLFIFTTTWAIAFIVGSVISSSLYTTLWVIFMHNTMFIMVAKN